MESHFRFLFYLGSRGYPNHRPPKVQRTYIGVDRFRAQILHVTSEARPFPSETVPPVREQSPMAKSFIIPETEAIT